MPKPTNVPLGIVKSFANSSLYGHGLWFNPNRKRFETIGNLWADISGVSVSLNSSATDNSASLQDAANSIPAEGGCLVLPAGSFEFKTSIDLKAKTLVVGKGAASVMRYSPGSDISPAGDQRGLFNCPEGADDCAFRDLTVSSDGYNAGITFHGAHRGSVIGCWLDSDAVNVNHTQVGFYPPSAGAVAGAMKGGIVANCHFRPGHITLAAQGNLSTPYYLDGIVFADNHIDCNGHNGASFDKVMFFDVGVRDSIMTGNTIEGADKAWDGYVVQEGCERCTVAGNTVVGLRSFGVTVNTGQTEVACKHVVITSNIIDDCRGGILLGHLNAANENIVVAHNTVSNCTDAGIKDSEDGPGFGADILFNRVTNCNDSAARTTTDFEEEAAIWVQNAETRVIGNTVKGREASDSTPAIRTESTAARAIIQDNFVQQRKGVGCIVIGSNWTTISGNRTFGGSGVGPSILIRTGADLNEIINNHLQAYEAVVGNTNRLITNNGAGTIIIGNTGSWLVNEMDSDDNVVVRGSGSIYQIAQNLRYPSKSYFSHDFTIDSTVAYKSTHTVTWDALATATTGKMAVTPTLGDMFTQISEISGVDDFRARIVLANLTATTVDIDLYLDEASLTAGAKCKVTLKIDTEEGL